MSVWPSNVVEVQGNLLECKQDYLVHQCNCVTTKGAHLSGDVFERFPHANIYADRAKAGHIGRDEPGTIIVRGGPGTDHRGVINLLGQYYPGKSRFSNDTGALRQQWFQSCLRALATQLPQVKSLAFPFNIGCGAAGGHWPSYQKMIIEFAQSLPNTSITLYKLI